uniref:Uncharacterized protein n=1 Tax=Setaria viridis TaxID=4556 RepID=A0A4U6UXX9_SETVI|nr:hypothetical protein SEVIR_4G087902v2 [Setaria viridis]
MVIVLFKVSFTFLSFLTTNLAARSELLKQASSSPVGAHDATKKTYLSEA